MRLRTAWCDTDNVEEVSAYLPGNYRVIGMTLSGLVLIGGVDNSGWTLKDYVIPRLGSTLIYCEEITK
jgi:hypothetical protein